MAAAAANAHNHAALKHASEAAVQGGANQKFHYDHKSGFITTYDGRVLDVNGGSKEAGAKVIAYDKKPNDNLNQQWDYKDGFFVTRMGTGFVIDINGGNINNGTDLILWHAKGNDNANQKWDIDAFGYIRSRANNNMCIDLSGGMGKGAGKIHLWTTSATKAQVDLVQKLKLHQHQRFHYDKHSGFITGFDGRVMDVNGGSKEAGAKLIMYPKKANDNANQQFDYKDGFFVTRMGTGFVIDINGGNISNGTDLILWNAKGNDNANQKWDVDEYGFIRSRANNKMGLDVKGGPVPSQGATPVILYTIGHQSGGI